MITIFFASCALFIGLYGYCRKCLLEASKAAKIAKSLNDDSYTIYLDGRPFSDSASLDHDGAGLDHQSILADWRSDRRLEKCRVSVVDRREQDMEASGKVR